MNTIEYTNIVVRTVALKVAGLYPYHIKDCRLIRIPCVKTAYYTTPRYVYWLTEERAESFNDVSIKYEEALKLLESKMELIKEHAQSAIHEKLVA